MSNETDNAEFDPYYKWLGIPKSQQPPTHYRLLGLVDGESSREVIEEAVIRQTTHLRTYQVGQYSAHCTRLLNEISVAQQVLGDPKKRQEYDQKLLQLAPNEPLATLPSSARRHLPRSHRRSRTSTTNVPRFDRSAAAPLSLNAKHYLFAVAACILAIAFVVALVSMFRPTADTTASSKAPADIHRAAQLKSPVIPPTPSPTPKPSPAPTPSLVSAPAPTTSVPPSIEDKQIVVPVKPVEPNDFLVTVMKDSAFKELADRFPLNGNRARNGTAEASNWSPDEKPIAVFRGSRDRNDWSARSSPVWFKANWTRSVEGQYIVIVGRQTPYGYDPWDTASIRINGGPEVPIRGMSGSHVILIDLKKTVSLSEIRLDIQGRDHPGIVSLEIHPATKPPLRYASLTPFRGHQEYFLAHADLKGCLLPAADATRDETHRYDATWEIVPGLFDSKSISFRATNPGLRDCFLVHGNFRVTVAKPDGSVRGNANSTFRRVPGLARPEWASFEAVTHKGHFLTAHSDKILYVDPYKTSRLFQEEATFEIVEPLAKIME
jgi:hypothetical protein